MVQRIRTDINLVFKANLQKDSLINDLILIYTLVNKLHPGQFIHCKKADFDNCFYHLVQSIGSNLSLPEFFIKSSSLLAKIKDGHTCVDSTAIKNKIETCLVFPFGIYHIDGRYFINTTGDKKYRAYIGKEVISINGKDIHNIITEIRSFISIEGENETGINYSLQLFPLYYFLINNCGKFKVEYKSCDGIIKTKNITGIPFKKYLKNIPETAKNVKQEFRNDNICILTLATFSISDFENENKDYKKYFDDFFDRVAKKKTANLIIDVRGNAGGSPEVSNYLFSYLTDKPYYYFECVGTKYRESAKSFISKSRFKISSGTSKPSVYNTLFYEKKKNKNDYWWFRKQKGRQNCFKGNLITLIDGASFSSSGHFIALLKNYKIGRVYGECSQGSYYSNDNTKMFQLPCSKLVVRIPTAQFIMKMTDFRYNSKGICPDISIQKNPGDFIKKYDRQLDFAIQDFLNKKK